MKIVTHNDRFHADDVFSMAVLRIALGDRITEIVRTRDQREIDSADIVFDVGGAYDPQRGRFDHHQPGGAGVRENGVPYASFGAVWKEYGPRICGSQEAADAVDSKLVQPIDAADNGYSYYSYTQDDLREYTVNMMCASFGATWKEEERYDEAFLEMADLAQRILRREIKVAQDKLEAVPLVEAAYERSEDKRIVVLDDYYPWGSVLEEKPEVLFAISPSRDKSVWRINAVQDGMFVNRRDLPAAWGGLRDEALEAASGVEGATFCHRNLFMAAAKTREAAVALAKKAVQS